MLLSIILVCDILFWATEHFIEDCTLQISYNYKFILLLVNYYFCLLTLTKCDSTFQFIVFFFISQANILII